MKNFNYTPVKVNKKIKTLKINKKQMIKRYKNTFFLRSI